MLKLLNLEGDWVFSSIATDGVDNMEEAAGAIIDNKTYQQLQKINIKPEDYILKFDTYNMFKKTEQSLLCTKKTKTNVGDVMLFLS